MFGLVGGLREIEELGCQVSLHTSGVEDNLSAVFEKFLDDERSLLQALFGQEGRVSDDQVEGRRIFFEVVWLQRFVVIVELEIYAKLFKLRVEFKDLRVVYNY